MDVLYADLINIEWQQVVYIARRLKMNTKEKTAFRKYTSLFLAFLVIAVSLLLVSCTQKEPVSVKESADSVVISVKNGDISDKGALSLLDYMNRLKDRGELTFTIDNGMITSVNGIKNADKYWMLYTSDAENSNPAWGTVEYEGKEYSSASLGAKELMLKPDTLYIWVYKAVN